MSSLRYCVLFIVVSLKYLTELLGSVNVLLMLAALKRQQKIMENLLLLEKEDVHSQKTKATGKQHKWLTHVVIVTYHTQMVYVTRALCHKKGGSSFNQHLLTTYSVPHITPGKNQAWSLPPGTSWESLINHLLHATYAHWTPRGEDTACI